MKFLYEIMNLQPVAFYNTQDAISTYLEAHKSIRTDGGDLQRADISAHTVDLGEDFYNFSKCDIYLYQITFAIN